jgi:hypothetical protein
VVPGRCEQATSLGWGQAHRTGPLADGDLVQRDGEHGGEPGIRGPLPDQLAGPDHRGVGRAGLHQRDGGGPVRGRTGGDRDPGGEPHMQVIGGVNGDAGQP